MKRIFFVLQLVCQVNLISYSQDTITKINGDKIICKIQNEDSTKVYFKMKWGSRDVTTFLNKIEISSIYYGEVIKPSFYDRSTVFRLDIILPALELETRTENYTTILVSYQPGFAFFKVNDDPANIYIVNQFKGSLRFFYNINGRMLMEKNTYNFSGDFYSVYALFALESSISDTYVTIGPTWGIQRTWGNTIHFSFEIGAGLVFSNSFTGLMLIAISRNYRLFP